MYKTIFLFYNFMIRKIGTCLLQVWPCGLLYILLYIITYTIIFYYCDFHRRQDKRGKTTLAARSSPSWLPYPLALSLPQRWSEYELVYFWALCLFFLPARSVSSRAALRPERAVLNQPEFQGWIVRGWGIAFWRLTCAQETILTASYVVFRLCLFFLPARSDSSRVALRPERFG